MNKDKIILDLCGGTGAWSQPYKENGYDVRVITLPDNDVRELRLHKDLAYNKVYGILAAPPCTQFSFAKTTGKPRKLMAGMEIVKACLEIIWECQYNINSFYAKTTSLKFWALENPKGLLKNFLGKPVFEFDPWEFGDNYKKKTCLWGWFNEPIKTYSKINEVMSNEDIELCKINSSKLLKFDRLKTKEIHPEFYGKLTRQERRAITPQGFAQAFYKANK